MNRSNGHLEQQNMHQRRQKDIDILRSHLETSIGDDTLVNGRTEQVAPSDSTIRVPSKQKSDDDITVHTSNVSRVKKKRRTRWSGTLLCIRVLMLDLPSLVIFSVLIGMCCLEYIYHEYHLKTLIAASRAGNDEQLRKEFTYYDRECSISDLSSKRGEGLLLSNNTTPEEAIDIVMTHGTGLIPGLLKHETMKELREYIDNRNNHLDKAEKIPVSQGKKRVSFGIEATEDPIIATALKELANHKLLEALLHGLVGEDPALTEITAITARYGAKNQAWHPDVKPDGNALKFARTYSHSYSLFIPLQDTPPEMGATTVCPGTHYCVSWDDTQEMCEQNGFQVSDSFPEKVWKAGNGFILNQQMWHRGAKHNMKGAEDRIVFIVSFIGRPDQTRQLSRGTYFHMKWLMWGHTFKDLHDAHISMAKPYSIFRSLSIWKPPNRNYGYDLITATIMRIANMQMGGHPDELPRFKKQVIEKIFHLPERLQGPVTNSNNAWLIYLEETMKKLINLLFMINAGIMTTFGIIICLIGVSKRSFRPLKTASFHMIFTHGLPALFAWRVLEGIRSSEWGRGVTTGRIMRPPFPDHLGSIKDTDVSNGPTTMPTRHDILIGSRFDAPYLGAYGRWLEYHPGNVEFQNQILKCKKMPPVLDSPCLHSIIVNQKGRILEQDWTNGDWRIMTPLESYRYAHMTLKKARNYMVDSMTKSLAILIAHNRFDIRDSEMSRGMRKQLNDLKTRMFDIVLPTSEEAVEEAFRRNRRIGASLGIGSVLPRIPDMLAKSYTQTQLIKTSPRWTNLSAKETLQVGDRVYINYNEEGAWFRGFIQKVRKKRFS
mmetsp:Transcript_21772/g.33055  ORF Transcript_21772/g.33055 Transcript_21772/m.33055 type:complete len:828 (-) Transcript_21772:201-2684(-)